MKKILIIVTIMMILINSLTLNNQFTLKDYFSGEYSSYTNENISNSSIDLGFCYLNTGTQLENSSIIGESMIIKNLEIDNALKTLKADVVKTEYLENGTTVIYALSPLINKRVTINNKTVNLQFALTSEHTVIGWPLILGSF